MRKIILLVFLANCGSSEQQPTLIYKPAEELSRNIGPMLPMDLVELRCYLPEGMYFIIAESKEVQCYVEDLLPEPHFRTLWVVDERLPCMEEIVKVYYTETLNYLTGEECPLVIVDRIYTTSKPQFLMFRNVTARCPTGSCQFVIQFSAWRPEE